MRRDGGVLGHRSRLCWFDAQERKRITQRRREAGEAQESTPKPVLRVARANESPPPFSHQGKRSAGPTQINATARLAGVGDDPVGERVPESSFTEGKADLLDND